MLCSLLFFNDTATAGLYPLSLHDALPIYPLVLARPSDGGGTGPAILPSGGGSGYGHRQCVARPPRPPRPGGVHRRADGTERRSEEHTSELQSRQYLVCRLLLETNKPSHAL